jgi:glycosyltransferase involved in cell wall biosynthesis
MISIIIPAHNNLRHLKNAYASVKKHAPEAELILLDDASTDGTWEWMQGLNDPNVVTYQSPTRDGHTVLYDVGAFLAKNEIIGIMHADMIMGPNYVENILKHLTKGKVVCATRIEPPLHPPGKEKIIMDFGMDFDSLNVLGFEQYCDELQIEFKDQTSKGMFAPWVLYKEDFFAIGGHDWGFAPFPYEDSDIFQRWLLAGYELIQSRDAFVYHLTCRGHRWTGTIGKNDNYFTEAEYKARNYYIKKWGSWIQNDEFGHPILKPVLSRCSIVKNYNESQLDPWLGDINPTSTDNYDVVIELDMHNVTNAEYLALTYLNEMVIDANELGLYEIGNMNVTVNSIEDRSHELIECTNDITRRL